ncbi:hypothetical protein Taro_008540 [Colocasia esculenta]|uniref:Ribosomal protein L18ae family n=1 Tax=Colocasia esculenta TaxID=4460 RepID=A0A843TXV4_COLES|nr:hypothetical protein [Colocasia esculenta]
MGFDSQTLLELQEKITLDEELVLQRCEARAVPQVPLISAGPAASAATWLIDNGKGKRLEAGGILRTLRLQITLYSMEGVIAAPVDDEKDRGKYTLVEDVEDPQLGMFDKRLPCFGCGIGWFSFLLGFAVPPMWYFSTILYFGNYYRKDPRERTGLAASAIAVSSLSFSVFFIMGRI